MRFKKIYLEITNVCNLHCEFCPKTARTPHFMSLDQFGLYAAKLRPFCDTLFFHLMGEPLLHPLLGEFLAAAERLAYRVVITTNGVLLGEKAPLLLNAPALQRVNISLHCFEGNEGQRAGMPLGFDDYVNTAAAFAAHMEQSGKIAVLRLWNDGGADRRNDEIRALLRQTFPGDWQVTRHGLRLSGRVWLENAVRFDWPGESGDEHPDGFCYGLRDQLGVLADGTVVPCCLDAEGRLALGDLNTDPVALILNSPRAVALYDGFSARRPAEPLCRRCGYARRFSKPDPTE